MKMLLAIMPTNLSEIVSQELISQEFRVTKFASTIGLLTQGTTTLLIVAEPDQIKIALEVIRDLIPPEPETDSAHARVTLYVIPVKEFGRV
jgi:uncharacterized protein YaaQ